DNSGNQYIFGWTNTLTGNTDAGAWDWGGNMVVHKINQLPNGDLTVGLAPSLRSYIERNPYTITKTRQWGNVTNTIPGTQSYRMISNVDMDVANVIFDPINVKRFKISATMSFA